MQGCEHGKGKSKPKMGLWSLGQGSWIRAWNGEGQAGSRCGVPKTETKVCGGMGYMVGDSRMSLSHGDAWIEVPVQCYTPCNTHHGPSVCTTVSSYSPSVSTPSQSLDSTLPSFPLMINSQWSVKSALGNFTMLSRPPIYYLLNDPPTQGHSSFLITWSVWWTTGGMELHGVAWRSGVLVSDRTWLQLMCCAPLRLWCLNFGGLGLKVWGYGDMRYGVMELQGVLKLTWS